MEFNRNHYFIVGTVILLLGFQLHYVDSFVLNKRVSEFLVNRLGTPTVATTTATIQQLLPAAGPVARKTVRPPEWLSFALISVGAVLVLHSLAMKKPGA
ncbi:MAG: hypothetical protein ACYC35_23995 [Pirellulales bacterium]